MNYLLTLLSTFIFVLSAWGQKADEIIYTQEDVRIFNRFCLENKYKQNLPMNDLVVETGHYFLGTPYVNFTLEVSDPETLIVNLRELDCVTFVENVVALARCIKTGNHDFDYYCETLRNLRYRGGKLTDFTSRLHYFSDWIVDNQELGLVQDRTSDFGGESYPIKVNLMSAKPNNYRQLKANPSMIRVIKELEENVISKRTMAYIPREYADSVGASMSGGYIVGTTTGWQMDITHCGFLIQRNGKPAFMHASSQDKQVIITDISLQEYLESKKTMNGFMVVEVLDPTWIPGSGRTEVVGVLEGSEIELFPLKSDFLFDTEEIPVVSMMDYR